MVQDLGAKQKLLRNQKRASKSSWSRRGNRKSFVVTNPLVLATPVKTFPGIIVREHLTVQRLMVMLKERYAEFRKELLQHFCNQMWMEIGGLSAKRTRSLVGWKTPYERRFGVPFDGPIIPFGWMIEYHPTSAKDLSRLHQFVKKVLPGVFLGNVLCAGRSGKETFWSQTSRSWKGWTHQKSTQETRCKRSDNAPKW